MREERQAVSRRDFLKTSSGAVAASVVAGPTAIAGRDSRFPGTPQKMRYAIVGTGIRAINMWGRDVASEYSDYVEFVGLCDINPGRLEFAKGHIGVDCPTFTDFSEMIRQTQPDTLCVTTMDNTHDEFIVSGMELGCDIVTEKPMTTDEVKCQAILDAQARTQRNIAVTFNYRYSPHRTKMKELLMEGRIGRLTSVDFHWVIIDRSGYVAYDNDNNEIKREMRSATEDALDTSGAGSLTDLHIANLLATIRGEDTLTAPIHDGRKSVLLCHLGNIAQSTGRALSCDPTTGHILDDIDAMTRWTREYEPGWEPTV